MKDKIYTEIICKGYCKYYKKGREDLHCNGYVFLRDNFTPYELKIMLDSSKDSNESAVTSNEKFNTCLPTGRSRQFSVFNSLLITRHSSLSLDEELMNLVCTKCDFFINECDYTDNRSGPPCGGYIIINLLCG